MIETACVFAIRPVPIAQVPVTRPGEELAALIERLGTTFDQRVLVFDQDQLVGIVSPADVARFIGVRQSLGGGAAQG